MFSSVYIENSQGCQKKKKKKFSYVMSVYFIMLHFAILFMTLFEKKKEVMNMYKALYRTPTITKLGK